jgi:PAS domain-containing protein
MSEAEYRDVQATRHLGIGVKVDVAPQRAKMAVSFLAHPGLYLRIEDGDIVLADQVVYRITGYNPADYTLTLELVKDWRPGEKDDPNAATQP